MIKRFFQQLFAATRYSLRGIFTALKLERAFIWEVVIFLPFIILATIVNFSPLEKFALIAPILLTFSFELMNTAIEKTIDELGDGKICQAFRFAKDAASGAVFFMLMMIVLSWVLIALPVFFS
ncbi:hypothetical protein IM40_08990 [Candidatus Paracaedimonas acanthamoebae]|nr:hypothetical protein IM40_08990 [Candidatus Paracaedimonas acanthamoebae]